MTLESLSVTALTVAILAVAVVASWTDLKTGRIPNRLTVSAFLFALVLRLPLGGGAVLSGLIGAAIAFTLILPLFVLGGFGGGDVKLLAAMGALLGVEGLVPALVATGIIGMVMAVVAAVRHGVLFGALRNLIALPREMAVALPRAFGPGGASRSRVAHGQAGRGQASRSREGTGARRQDGGGRSVPSSGVASAGSAGTAGTARTAVTVPYGIAIGFGALIGQLYGFLP